MMSLQIEQTREYRLRWWILVAIAISVLIIVLDTTIVNIALPTLQRELDATMSQLQWISNAYILAFGSLMLTMGALGDRIGRKRMLQIGIILFAAGSLAGSFVSSAEQLIGLRAIMGIGGAMIAPATLAIITNVFPKNERGRAIGVWAGLNSIGVALGPIVGGLIVDNIGWEWIFLVNIPVAIVALVLGWFLIPESRNPQARPIDIPGTVLSAAGLASLVFGLIQGSRWGWTNPGIISALAGAVVIIALFILWESRTRYPMLDVSFFRSARFSAGVATVSIMALAMMGLSFGLTLYMQFVRDYSALQTGVRQIPFALGMFIGAGMADRIVKKLGTTRVIAGGFTGAAAVAVITSFWEVGTVYWVIGLVLFGIGFFLGNIAAPAADAVMGALPEERAGIGSAMNSSSRIIAGSLGIAVLGTTLSDIYTSSFEKATASFPGIPSNVLEAAGDSVGAAVTIADKLPGGAGELLAQTARTSFMDGWQVMAFVTCGLCVVGALVILKYMPSR